MRVGVSADSGRGCGVTEIDRRYHDVANIFPLMSGEEFEALKADIAQHGLRESIWLHPDGSIVDGRNRHRACIETNTTPTFRTWDGNGSLVAFVVSMNLHRRHLTSGQRAMAAAKIANMPQGARTDLQHSANLPNVSQAEAADLLHVSERSVRSAKTVHEQGTPELATLVEFGEVAVSTAADIATLPIDEQKEVVARGEKEILAIAKQIRKQKAEQRLIERRGRIEEICSLPDKVYNVLYIDPPWQYNNTGVHGAANHHYPTMSIEQLECLPNTAELRIACDAVLFLWITNPLMAEAFHLIEKWGFQYKTNMVWVKTELQKPGSGFYVRGRHELLFIATRGNFTPLNPNVSPPIGSVVEAPVQEHSRKPCVFYDIIEQLYPGCNYLEMFARSHREKWDAWGNQIDRFDTKTTESE